MPKNRGLIASIVVVFLGFLLVTREPVHPLIPGDVNGDGKVDLRDVVLALRGAVGVTTLTPDQVQAADVAPFPGTEGRTIGDGKVSLEDVIRLLRFTVGLLHNLAGPQRWPILLARYTSTPPTKEYWEQADYYEVELTNDYPDGSSGQWYGGPPGTANREYNMTATGRQPGLKTTLRMKAAYTSQDLYLWLQWKDISNTHDRHRRRWVFNGPDEMDWKYQHEPKDPGAPGIPPGTPTVPGWTSQWNDDKFSLIFDIDGKAADATGSFTGSLTPDALKPPADAKGCTVACHADLGMGVPTGKIDIWHWKTSRSNPQGLVNDQWAGVTDEGRVQARTTDAGTPTEIRNRPKEFPKEKSNTIGPAFVWDPSKPQPAEFPPELYLLKGYEMPIEGDAVAGDAIYQEKCQKCHGADGKGVNLDLAVTGLKETSEGLREDVIRMYKQFSLGDYTDAEVNNLVARVRAFAGVPGYLLDFPKPGESSGDIQVLNAREVYSDGVYTVIIRRPLNTGHPDDVQFDPSKAYVFGVAVMDADGINHMGKAVNLLRFLPPGATTLPGLEPVSAGQPTPPPPPPPPAQALSFATDIKPLASVCAGCHPALKPDAGAMDNLDNLLSKGYVKPGDPDNSDYYLKPSGKKPHAGGAAWGANAQKVYDWIKQGAKP